MRNQPDSVASAPAAALVCGLLAALASPAAEGSEPPPHPTTESAAAAPAAAQDASGTIAATLAGDARIWYVTSAKPEDDRFGRSDWSEPLAGRVSVSLTGRTSRDTVTRTANALTLSFTVTVPEAGADADIVSAEIAWHPGDAGRAYTSSAGGTATIRLESMAIDGDILQISGTFDGTLGLRAGQPEPEAGPARMRVEGGRFEATLGYAD